MLSLAPSSQKGLTSRQQRPPPAGRLLGRRSASRSRVLSPLTRLAKNMPADTFSAYHEHVATTLAREMNAYFAHSEKMSRYFEQRDVRGNAPVYTHRDRAETEERRLKVIVFCAIYVEALANLYLSLKLTTEQFAAVDRVEI